MTSTMRTFACIRVAELREGEVQEDLYVLNAVILFGEGKGSALFLSEKGVCASKRD